MTAERSYVRSVTGTLLTAYDLLHTHIPDKRVELVRGVLIVREPPGFLHGDVAMRLAVRLSNHADAHGLGHVLAAETGFKLQSNPDTVRAADLAFLSSERFPDPRPEGYPAMAPDLVVEVLSPSDRPGEVLAKIGDWLEAGARLVWVVDPRRRHARIYRQDGTEAVIAEHENLDGEDVLPGFSCQLTQIL
jgi:Uma2 family endonuclease